MNKRFAFYLVVLLLAALALPPAGLAQDFPRICLNDPANLMPNCRFDNGLDGWQPFTEDGAANISYLQGGGECHAPQCPAAYIVVDSHFVGGIYQQVPAAAGNTYYANINWLVFDSVVNDASVNSVLGGIGRRVGIDPFGGTDSRSSNVIWGPDNWRSDCKTCEVEYATATAQADTITIFIRLDDTWRLRAAEKGYNVPPGKKDQFWLDEVGLKQISGDAAPAAQLAEAPPTEPPTAEPAPTNTPAVNEATPTDTPEPKITPTGAPTETESAPEKTQPISPISTPTEPAEATEAAVIAAPPTLTPTMTRTPTLTPTLRPTREPTSTRRPTVEPSAASMMPGGFLGIAGTTLCAGGLILVIMAVAIAGLIWLYRLGWGKTDDDLFDDDFEDDDSIVVEIVED